MPFLQADKDAILQGQDAAIAETVQLKENSFKLFPPGTNVTLLNEKLQGRIELFSQVRQAVSVLPAE